MCFVLCLLGRKSRTEPRGRFRLTVGLTGGRLRAKRGNFTWLHTALPLSQIWIPAPALTDVTGGALVTRVLA